MIPPDIAVGLGLKTENGTWALGAGYMGFWDHDRWRYIGGIGKAELNLDYFTVTGQAFYIGPTAYFQLSPRSRLTASWSVQAWGRPAGSSAALDLVNFERHQARLVFGVNF